MSDPSSRLIRGIFSEGILIALGSSYVYLTTFFYELGYCRYFGIPASFINPNLTTVLVAAAAIGGLLFSSLQLFGLSVPLLRAGASPNEKQRPYRQFFLLNGLLLILAVLMVQAYGITWKGALLFVGLAFFLNFIYFGIGLIANWKKPLRERFELMNKAEPDAFDIWALLIEKLGRGWVRVILFVICTTGIAYLIGNGEAVRQDTFFVMSETNDYVFLRTYGDLIIAAPVDRKAKKIQQHFLLLKTSSKDRLELRAEKLGPLEKAELLASTPPGNSPATAVTASPANPNPAVNPDLER